MSTERYLGERRALWHFLSELQPLIIASLGEDALLRHRIERALKAGDLEQLRSARRMFHNLPDDLKRRLMRGIFDGTGADLDTPGAEPAQTSTSYDAHDGKPPAAIRFKAFPAACDDDVVLSVERDGEGLSSHAPVQVTVEPGTLPRSAAETLRQIANWIEHDRRLLSTQHWVLDDDQAALSDETLDQA